VRPEDTQYEVLKFAVGSVKLRSMDRWPMVGRAEEQRFIADAIANPERSGVLVAGRAGVGKTRLIHEVLSTTDDHHLEWVTASESVRSLPFGALAQLLPSNLSEVDQLDLLSVLGHHLQSRAGTRPIVVAVDDVHLLDGPSAGFIDYVATRGLATVLLTLRSGSPVPDALNRLCRNDDIPRLELQALSRSEFDEMLEGALDGIIEGVSLERMWEATRGNVLFARQLISDVLEVGSLRKIHGVWRWAGGVGPAPRLREAIASRLDGLTDSGRRFLELLSIGEPLVLEVAQRVASEELLLELERRGLIAVVGDGAAHIRFSHPLFGEVLRAEMPALLNRQLNQQLAHILREQVERTPADLLKLAVLWQGSGERVDPTILAEAAQVANRLSDHPLAETLAGASLKEQRTFLAQLELAWSLLSQHHFGQATELLVPLVGTEPDDNARERLAEALSLALGHGLRRVDDALALMTEIEDSAVSLTTRVLIQCHRASLHSFVCQYEKAIELGMSAIEADDDDRVFVRALTSVASSLVMIGKTQEALSLTEAGLACALRVREELPRAPNWAVSSRCTALAFAGRAPEALELLDFVVSSLSSLPPEMRSPSSMYRARLLLFEGRAAGAARTLKEAALNLRSDPSYGSWCLALLAEAEALLGHLDAAEAARSESLALRGNERLSMLVDERRALAWVDAQSGRLSDAIAELWAAADMALERGQRCFELIILDDLLRLGEVDAAARGRAASEAVDGALAEAVGLHARAVVSGRGIDLEQAASSFADLNNPLIASELWAAASTAYRREGLQARSTKAAKRSHETAGVCDGATMLSAAWPDQVEPLSRRQREVALLAAEGASNAEIARVLSLSVRTVESHLYAAFAKLGLTGREELTLALAGAPD
jgi:DNA-binding CsgD family transcriptional regulator/tetratricopeptide (TPR) repeat protein